MATLEYITNENWVPTGAVASKTFSGVSLGAADPNRIIVITGCFGTAAGGESISSATIGGVAATIGTGGGYGGSGDDGMSRIFWAKVPTGTTGDVVINFSGNATDGCIGVFRVIADSISAFDSDTLNENTADPINLSVDVEAGGFIVGFLNNKDSAPASASWTIDGVGATAFTRQVGSGSATFVGVGILNFAAGESGVAASCDRSDTTNNMTCSAVAFSAVEVPVGPTNLKNRSGNLKANIKNLSGNLIGNTKNLSGNT